MFLKDLSTYLLAQNSRLHDVMVVFPNQRPAIFLKRMLVAEKGGTLWMPQILDLNDFMKQAAAMQMADPIRQVIDLHSIFVAVTGSEESLESFYAWGEMMLRDFSDVDRQLADAELLFANVSDFKELDASLSEVLEPWQIELIEHFWGVFNVESTEQHEIFKKYRAIWQYLMPVYEAYYEHCLRTGFGYAGLLERQAVRQIDQLPARFEGVRRIYFCGFNYLTKAERHIITKLVADGRAECVWDVQPWYLTEQAGHQAGRYFREFAKDPVLGPSVQTWARMAPENQPVIHSYSVPGVVTQAKFAGKLVRDLLPTIEHEERTALLLPDASLLLPTLSSLPYKQTGDQADGPGLRAVNTTMGLPFRFTALYSFLELVADMQTYAIVEDRGGEVPNVLLRTRCVANLLRHPYLAFSLPTQVSALRILNSGRTKVKPLAAFQSGHDYLDALFQVPASRADVFAYAKKLLIDTHNLLKQAALRPGEEDRYIIESEYVLAAYTTINRLETAVPTQFGEEDRQLFWKLIRTVLRTCQLPLVGEPVLGLQVMGMLESRSLCFDNVIILSVNEGSLPGKGQDASFIPHSLRKAFRLPIQEDRDAIEAHTFYRLLRNAKNLHLIYSNVSEGMGGGQPSRYLLQLRYDGRYDLQEHVTGADLAATSLVGISREIEPAHVEKLVTRRLSATAFNSWLNCRLQFYFKFICNLAESNNTLLEEVDPTEFGNLYHKIMERLYARFAQDGGSRIINESDLDEVGRHIDKVSQEVFQDYLDEQRRQAHDEGFNYLTRQALIKAARRTISADKLLAGSLRLHALEKEVETQVQVPLANGPLNVRLMGRIDRLDSVETVEGPLLRIADYKTGTPADKRQVLANLDQIWNREEKDVRSQANDFQLLWYTMVYRQAPLGNGPAVPSLNYVRANYDSKEGLLDRTSIYLKGDNGEEMLTSNHPVLDEMLDRIKAELQLMLTPGTPITQTPNVNICGSCDYNTICQRKV